MRTALLSALGFAATAAATNCQVGHGGIYSPAPNSTIVLGQPFNLTFCTGAYFKTHTIDIDIITYSCLDESCAFTGSSEEAVHALQPEGTYGYHTNVTLHPISGNNRPGKWAIGVLDHTSGYYTQGEVYSYFVPVQFVEEESKRA